jgi:DNA-binding MarR family transcriptional regulator
MNHSLVHDGAGPVTLGSFLRTAEELQAQLQASLRKVGLSSAQFQVLRQLHDANQPVPLHLLSETQRCVPSNMTTLVDRLERDGLVRRVADPLDRRSTGAELTGKGRDLTAAGIATANRLQRAFINALTPEEHASLGKMLTALHAL